ncbi:hypothetical protein EDB19DRAFT_1835146, partial [Suillus lakei]
MSPSLMIFFLAIICFFLAVHRARRKSPSNLSFPPGPKGLPVLGNLLDLNGSQPWGSVIYCKLFGRQIIVLQSQEVAKALLEHRSSIYSDRPPLSSTKAIGSEFNSAQLTRQLLQGIIEAPERYQRHIELFASSVIMSAVYDYEAKPNDDPLLLAAEKAIKVFLEVASPQTSAILETFPFLLKLPSWFPGASFKRLAIQSQKNATAMVDIPFRYARERV